MGRVSGQGVAELFAFAAGHLHTHLGQPFQEEGDFALLIGVSQCVGTGVAENVYLGIRSKRRSISPIENPAMKNSRRTFLKWSAAAAVAAKSSLRSHALSSLAEISPDAQKPLNQFGYEDVELHEGPMLQQFQANLALFLALDDDKLLKPFRQRAGQAAPGEDMGGWYDNAAEFDPHGTFMGSFPDTVLDNTSQDWPGPRLLPARRRQKRRFTGW